MTEHSPFETVLLALELDPESDADILRQGKEIAEEFSSNIILLHAMEHMSSYGAAYGVAAGAEIEELMIDSARKELAKIGDELGVPKERQILKVGPAKFVILEEAEQNQADLIMVGSHGRHGLRLLLGSTANAVLHGANCDVLAVRLKQ